MAQRTLRPVLSTDTFTIYSTSIGIQHPQNGVKIVDKQEARQSFFHLRFTIYDLRATGGFERSLEGRFFACGRV